MRLTYIDQEGIDLADPEAVTLVTPQAPLHPLIAGLVLAAIMSTFSSQLGVCSSALVEDIYTVLRIIPPSERNLVILGRACVLAVAIIAVALAVDPNDTILGLVSVA